MATGITLGAALGGEGFACDCRKQIDNGAVYEVVASDDDVSASGTIKIAIAIPANKKFMILHLSAGFFGAASGVSMSLDITMGDGTLTPGATTLTKLPHYFPAKSTITPASVITTGAAAALAAPDVTFPTRYGAGQKDADVSNAQEFVIDTSGGAQNILITATNLSSNAAYGDIELVFGEYDYTG